MEGLEWTFDSVARTYEKMRPGYVDELYRMLFDYIPISGSSNVLEVGIGGRQATLPVLRTGCKLTAVECGERFSKLCREKFKDYPNFSVVTGRIEKIYGQYYYKFHNRKQESLEEYDEKQVRNRAMTAEKYGFHDIRYALFFRTRTFSAKEYIMLLGTYSDHIAIEETVRMEFFSKIEEAVNRHSGKITIYDTIDLQLARKP